MKPSANRAGWRNRAPNRIFFFNFRTKLIFYSNFARGHIKIGLQNLKINPKFNRKKIYLEKNVEKMFSEICFSYNLKRNRNKVWATDISIGHSKRFCGMISFRLTRTDLTCSCTEMFNGYGLNHVLRSRFCVFFNDLDIIELRYR